MTLRTRILLSLAPLAILLVALGASGFALLDHMGGRIEAILRKNYAGVQAMFRLNDATERIDSSFQFALAGRETEAVPSSRHIGSDSMNSSRSRPGTSRFTLNEK